MEGRYCYINTGIESPYTCISCGGYQPCCKDGQRIIDNHIREIANASIKLKLSILLEELRTKGLL